MLNYLPKGILQKILSERPRPRSFHAAMVCKKMCSSVLVVIFFFRVRLVDNVEGKVEIKGHDQTQELVAVSGSTARTIPGEWTCRHSPSQSFQILGSMATWPRNDGTVKAENRTPWFFQHSY